jgi:hypothetical protein
MPKPEANFISRVHRKLDASVYKQAMGLTSTNGTPDYYYEGNAGHLWVEYKWYPEKPKFVDLCDTSKKPSLSRLQQRWLERAHGNKQPVVVVAGFPGGCFVFLGVEWKLHMDEHILKAMTMTEQAWIETLNELNL